MTQDLLGGEFNIGTGRKADHLKATRQRLHYVQTLASDRACGPQNRDSFHGRIILCTASGGWPERNTRRGPTAVAISARFRTIETEPRQSERQGSGYRFG